MENNKVNEINEKLFQKAQDITENIPNTVTSGNPGTIVNQVYESEYATPFTGNTVLTDIEAQQSLNVAQPTTQFNNNVQPGTIGNVTEIDMSQFDSSDPGDALLLGAMQAKKEAETMSQVLHQHVKNEEVPDVLMDANDDSNSLVDDLLAEIEEENTKKELDVTDTDDLDVLLSKLESEKIFVEIPSNEERTGPSDYTVEIDETYVNTIEDICKSNGINVIKKSATERNAILDRFTNSGPEVSVALVNSGIFIKSTGAGPSEIIAMNQIRANSAVSAEVNKLQHVCQHIVGSSIGRLSINKLIKVVSYYDKDTLYYALYAGTYPDVSELSRGCERCGREYYMNVKTSDLLLNSDEFESASNYIRNDVVGFDQLVQTSELGKEYRKLHSSGMIIYYKHPSIESYIRTLGALKPEIIEKYSHLVDLVYGIKEIRIFDKSKDFISYVDPNEIVNILSKLKSADEKYEIYDMLDEIKPQKVPAYGYKESKCPHCGNLNSQQAFPMEQLLFFKAQKEEERAGLKWAARAQKRSKEKSKKK